MEAPDPVAEGVQKPASPPRQTPAAREGLRAGTLATALVLVTAVAVGGAVSALVNYDLIGLGHLPRCAVFAVVILLVANALCRRFGRGHPFGRGQLAFVYIAVLVMAGIPGQQLVTYLYVGMIGSQYHAAGSSSEYRTEVLPYLKPWMVPVQDPADPFNAEQPVISWAMHGMPWGASVPWRPWVRPLLLWTPYLLALLFLQVCLAALLRRRWDEERLTYPLAQAPIELMTYASEKAALPKLMTSPLFWGMALIPAVVHTKNALAMLYPYAFTRIDLNKNVGVIFGEAPWSNFDYLPIQVYFETIGATYLIPVGTGFSLWFFWLVRRFICVYRDTQGLIDHQAYLQQQGIGAYLLLAALCVWGARKSLAEAFQGAVSRGNHARGDSSHEPLAPRWAVMGVVLSLATTLAWGVAAGGTPLSIGLMMALHVAGMIVLSRLVAECGLFCVWTPLCPPQEMVARTFGAFRPLSPQATTALCYMGWKVQDTASMTMANVMQGFKVAEMASIRPSSALWLMVGALVLGVFASHPPSLKAIYENGYYALGWWPRGTTDAVPASIHNLTKGLTAFKGENATAVAHGALVVTALHLLRTQFHRFPLQPFAYAAALGPQFMMDRYGFSIFIGWCFKHFVLKYGGVATHSKLRPAAFGLIAGNAAILLLWTLYFYFHPVEGVLVTE
ncbi:MAG TPA: hypothetical protein PLQ54_01255 [Armatimonadota bacterium]|mgnify:CR=1 FL=1|nr:hypothetical protein [Armatimonadota bacterium]